MCNFPAVVASTGLGLSTFIRKGEGLVRSPPSEGPLAGGASVTLLINVASGKLPML